MNWHLQMRKSPLPICDMPPLLNAGFVCGHASRGQARAEGRRISASGRQVRIVRGDCPRAPKARVIR
jgi:hypothetical protein